MMHTSYLAEYYKLQPAKSIQEATCGKLWSNDKKWSKMQNRSKMQKMIQEAMSLNNYNNDNYV
jgi:hypothetical protein